MRAAVPILPAAAALAVVLLAGSVRGGEDPSTRGARIAALGNGHGAPACASCHAYDGSGDPSGAFPRLTGQAAHYLGHALETFADGERRSAVMTPIATALTEAERRDVAAYYASVSAPVPPVAASDPAAVERGRVTANVGLNDQQVPACVACHGPSGRSMNPTVPTLAGQYSQTIVFALKMFSDGYRKNDQMNDLAHALTEQQRRDVAAYFQQVGPSPPKQTAGADARAGAPARSTAP